MSVIGLGLHGAERAACNRIKSGILPLNDNEACILMLFCPKVGCLSTARLRF
jgi:hypothetical protein